MGEVLTNTVCKVCGVRYITNLHACPQCGAVEKTDGQAVAWVDSFPVAIDKCPACSSPSIRKVSEIYRSARPIGPEAGFAKQVAPPKKPVATGRLMTWFPLVVACGSSLVVFAGVVVLSAQELAPNPGQALPSWDITLCGVMAVLGFALGWLVAHLATSRRRAALEEDDKADLDRWVGEMEVWERLYYCESCEKVSDPLVGRSAHVYAMDRLLDK